MIKPKVSVCIVTYNQEKFIRDCLESVVTQETDFPFEIIVGDDASTDGTTEIVKEYIAKYPHLVKGVLHKKNCGPTKNYFSVHNLAQGEYIAHIDGDNYALPGKLQVQSDFLDRNLDCNFVAHRMIYVDLDRGPLYYPEKANPLKSDIVYLVKNLGYFPHSSKMYRAERSSYKYFKTEETILDAHLYLFHARNGKIGYIPQYLGVYRYGVGLMTSSPRLVQKLAIKSFEYALLFGVNKKIVSRSCFYFMLQVYLNCLGRKDFNDVDKSINIIFLPFHFRFFWKILNKMNQYLYVFYKLFRFIKKIKNKSKSRSFIQKTEVFLKY